MTLIVIYIDESEIYFYVNYRENMGTVMIEALEVAEKMQRRGIGTLLFNLMHDFVMNLNQHYKELGIDIITKITGELIKGEYPYDEFEKSVPFYAKQAVNLNMGFKLWEKDSYTILEKEVQPNEYSDFLDSGKNGRIEFELQKWINDNKLIAEIADQDGCDALMDMKFE